MEPLSPLQPLAKAPYSAPLNPIEMIWSTLKERMKSSLASTRTEVLVGPSPDQRMTQTEFRLRHLEDIIDASFSVVTPQICLRTYNHVQKHYQRCLEMEDLQVGL